jgi:hypothetical protein
MDDSFLKEFLVPGQIPTFSILRSDVARCRIGSEMKKKPGMKYLTAIYCGDLTECKIPTDVVPVGKSTRVYIL